MDQSLISKLFDCALDSPGAWLFKAWQLKRTADEINPFDRQDLWEHPESQDILHLTDVYLFLLGSSFEVLIKGILVAQGIPAGGSGELDRGFRTHKIRDLLACVDTSQLPLSQEECDLMVSLQPYILWAGRYPTPKRQDDYFVIVHEHSKRAVELDQKRLALWDRLFDYLKDVGWLRKVSGKKIYIVNG